MARTYDLAILAPQSQAVFFKKNPLHHGFLEIALGIILFEYQVSAYYSGSNTDQLVLLELYRFN